MFKTPGGTNDVLFLLLGCTCGGAMAFPPGIGEAAGLPAVRGAGGQAKSQKEAKGRAKAALSQRGRCAASPQVVQEGKPRGKSRPEVEPTG